MVVKGHHCYVNVTSLCHVASQVFRNFGDPFLSPDKVGGILFWLRRSVHSVFYIKFLSNNPSSGYIKPSNLSC